MHILLKIHRQSAENTMLSSKLFYEVFLSKHHGLEAIFLSLDYYISDYVRILDFLIDTTKDVD
jgi:hypothetical protein